MIGLYRFYLSKIGSEDRTLMKRILRPDNQHEGISVDRQLMTELRKQVLALAKTNCKTRIIATRKTIH